ncbi:MAG: TIR domain-containing protein [Armatimonadota bacterium]
MRVFLVLAAMALLFCLAGLSIAYLPGVLEMYPQGQPFYPFIVAGICLLWLLLTVSLSRYLVPANLEARASRSSSDSSTVMLSRRPVLKDIPGDVEVLLVVPLDGRQFRAEVPADMTASEMVAYLVETLELPDTDSVGTKVEYRLFHASSGRFLEAGSTFPEAEVEGGDEVHLVEARAMTEEATGKTDRSLDLVDLRLSAFHPKEVLAEETHRLVAYAHVERAKTEVARHALETLELRAEEIRASSERARQSVSRAVEVQVVPQAEGLTFSPSQQFLSLWEDWQAAEFLFRPAADQAGGACNGRVMFLVEGVLIADVPVSVLVSAADADAVFGEAIAEVAASPYRRIFPSHSHEDLEIVEACERYAAMCGDEYLRDVRALRSGEEWSPRLLELIDAADVFQLFWSPNAAQSPYVEQEWQHALTRDAGSFIRPIYWRQPMADPPAELAHVHFAFVELGGGH